MLTLLGLQFIELNMLGQPKVVIVYCARRRNLVEKLNFVN